MSDAAYWADLRDDARDVILTPEEIEAFNQDTYIASGTMVMDLTSAKETFDGKARNEAVTKSSTADAEYYFGWTYGPDGEKAEWSYYQKVHGSQGKVQHEGALRHCRGAHHTAGVPLQESHLG